MESFPIESLPTAGDIHMACFVGVKNAPELKERFQNQDETLAFALVESTLVGDTQRANRLNATLFKEFST